MELTLLKTKIVLEKIWLAIKCYWKDIAFAGILLYLVFFAKQKIDLSRQLMKEWDDARKAYQENIDRLNQTIQGEVATRRKIESDFQNLIERINTEHDEEVKKIALVREEEIKKLIKKHQNNPVALAQTMNDLFGIPVMPVPSVRQPWEPPQ